MRRLWLELNADILPPLTFKIFYAFNQLYLFKLIKDLPHAKCHKIYSMQHLQADTPIFTPGSKTMPQRSNTTLSIVGQDTTCNLYQCIQQQCMRFCRNMTKVLVYKRCRTKAVGVTGAERKPKIGLAPIPCQARRYLLKLNCVIALRWIIDIYMERGS